MQAGYAPRTPPVLAQVGRATQAIKLSLYRRITSLTAPRYSLML